MLQEICFYIEVAVSQFMVPQVIHNCELILIGWAFTHLKSEYTWREKKSTPIKVRFHPSACASKGGSCAAPRGVFS